MTLLDLTQSSHPSVIAPDAWLALVLARRKARAELILGKITGTIRKPRETAKALNDAFIAGLTNDQLLTLLSKGNSNA